MAKVYRRASSRDRWRFDSKFRSNRERAAEHARQLLDYGVHATRLVVRDRRTGFALVDREFGSRR